LYARHGFFVARMALNILGGSEAKKIPPGGRSSPRIFRDSSLGRAKL
jgi:hypothetical protein